MKAPRSVFLILFLLNSFFTYEIFSHSAHVLYQLPEWVSAKSVIPNGLISAKNFFLERQTLAGDELNLASLNGPNEVRDYISDCQYCLADFRSRFYPLFLRKKPGCFILSN